MSEILLSRLVQGGAALAALCFAVRHPPQKDPRDGVVWILKSRTGDFINFPTTETPFEGSRTRMFRPRIIARRIAAGRVFTVHKALKGGKFVPLNRNKVFSGRLVKIRIGPESFAPLRRQLHACGVSHLSMVPDLDGVGAHLTWRYAWYDDEHSPKLRHQSQRRSQRSRRRMR